MYIRSVWPHEALNFTPWVELKSQYHLSYDKKKLKRHLMYDKLRDEINVEVGDYQYTVDKRKTGPYLFVLVGIS